MFSSPADAGKDKEEGLNVQTFGTRFERLLSLSK